MDRSSRYLLMTGAAGLIGSQVLARLLRRHEPVCAVVRATEQQSERSRIEAVLKAFEASWGQRLPRPTIVAGDLTKPGLGLSRSDCRVVTEHCSSVLHLAASLSFSPASRSPTNEPYRTNVEGTRELLSLCGNAGIHDFHYVSTAYVCGSYEGTFHESDLEVGQSFSNDYEHSKVLAERLLRESNELAKLTVYRPSIVIDTSGNSPVSQDRTLYAALSLYRTMSKKFGAITDGNWYELLGCSGRERKNLVEAAWVADVIDGILQQDSLHGQTYHLTSSFGTAIHDMETAFQQVVERGEGRSSTADRASPSAALKQAHALRQSTHVGSKLFAFSKKAISLGTRTIATTMASPYLESFGPYFRNDPKFDRRNLDSALAELKLPDVDRINADTIARFAGLQESKASTATAAVRSVPQASDLSAGRHSRRSMSPTSSTDKTNPITKAGPIESWACRLQAWQTLSSREQQATTVSPQGSGWGVCLSGEEGGDWQIEIDPLRVTAAGHGCHRRAYLDVDTWERLLDQESTCQQSLALGQLVIEFDNHEADVEDDVLGEFQQLLTSLRQYGMKSWEGLSHD